MKAIELWKRGAELGSCNANAYLGYVYLDGRGVEKDIDRGIHYNKLAAIGGHEIARHLNCGNGQPSLAH